MTIIQRHDGETIDLDDAGIRTRDFIISSPNPIHNFGGGEDGIGLIDNGTDIGPRDITCYFRAISQDIEDFSLLRDEIFHIFRTEESFYLIEHREPGKRWLVKVQDSYNIPQKNVFGNFDISFIGLKGVSESIHKSMWINNNGVPSDWKGMGFEGIENPTYRYRGYGGGVDESGFLLPFFPYENSDAVGHFRIYNAGNVEVHPYEQDLNITIYNAIDSTEYFELTNETNGTKIRLNEGLRNRRLVFDNANVTLGGAQAYRKTDRSFISLEPGWNDFIVKGAQTVTIDFDFPFYYK